MREGSGISPQEGAERGKETEGEICQGVLITWNVGCLNDVLHEKNRSIDAILNHKFCNIEIYDWGVQIEVWVRITTILVEKPSKNGHGVLFLKTSPFVWVKCLR